jgi:hypothetical protein
MYHMIAGETNHANRSRPTARIDSGAVGVPLDTMRPARKTATTATATGAGHIARNVLAKVVRV